MRCLGNASPVSFPTLRDPVLLRPAAGAVARSATANARIKRPTTITAIRMLRRRKCPLMAASRRAGGRRRRSSGPDSRAGSAVDGLTDQVGVAVMTGVFLDHVQKDPSEITGALRVVPSAL
jgi:hypothetical protein